MKYTIITLLFLFACTSYAQPFTLKKLEGDSGQVAWEILSPQRPEVAKKINVKIFHDWGYDPTSKSPFSARSIEEEYYGAILTNNDRVLSMVLQSSYAACGLHITRIPYCFDARTGAEVGAAALFSPDGTTKLKKALQKSWKATLKAAITDGSTSDFYLQQYKDCLAAADQTSEQEFSRFEVTDTGIKFWAGSCLEGTTYDFEADASQGPHFYSFGQLLPMLTPYGYTMFADKLTGPVQNLLRGTIDGKYPISLTILPVTPGEGDGPVKGMIVYDRVGQPINIKGTRAGNQFVIHELDESNQPLSNIDLTWDGSKLTGAFYNLKSKKQMPFVASPVNGK